MSAGKVCLPAGHFLRVPPVPTPRFFSRYPQAQSGSDPAEFACLPAISCEFPQSPPLASFQDTLKPSPGLIRRSAPARWAKPIDWLQFSIDTMTQASQGWSSLGSGLRGDSHMDKSTMDKISTPNPKFATACVRGSLNRSHVGKKFDAGFSG